MLAQSSAHMRIDVATPADCRAIAEVHVASWRRAYAGILPAPYLASLSIRERELRWQHDLSEHHTETVFVARLSEQVIGFGVVGPCRDTDAPADRGELWAIYVSPDYWRHGVGRQLWLAGLCRLRADRYRTATAWVLAGNQRAINFYTHAGFIVEPASRKQVNRDGIELDIIRYLYRLPAQPLGPANAAPPESRPSPLAG